MRKRKSISTKTRFDIFKRDKFTCQYCGNSAPEVVLQVDHINPVVHGGKNDLLNLVTSCSVCNGGKGATPLSDGSAIAKQQAMLADLEERRQQLEMMVQWRDELRGIQQDSIEAIVDRFQDRAGLSVTDAGRADIRKWVKTFTFADVMRATDEALDTYSTYENDKVTAWSASSAFTKIPGIARTLRAQVDKPYLRRLFYIQGIARKCTEEEDLLCLDFLEHIHSAGESLDDLERFVKTIRYPSHILRHYERWLESVGKPYTAADGGFTYRSSYARRR